MVQEEIDEDFICCFLAGEVDEEEEIVFRRMFAEDEELRNETERVGRTWYYGKYAGKWGRVDEKKAWRNIEVSRVRRIRYKKIVQWNIAALLLLLIGVGVVILLQDQKKSALQLVEDALPIYPGQSRALLVLASGEKVELGAVVNKEILDGGVIIKGDSAALIYPIHTASAASLFNELIVPVAGEYRLSLSDGTVVYLNSESKLRYPVNFGKGEREVELEGEAYFEVASDKDHPFRVKTADLNVQVWGTGFNVSAYQNADFSEITLAHGVVAVGERGKELILKPDEQLIFDKQSGKMSVQPIDARKICAWKNGILYFEGMPLGELAVKLSRWFDVQFFFTFDKLKQLKFTGAFKKYNSINYVLSLIESTTDIKVQIKGRTIVVDYK